MISEERAYQQLIKLNRLGVDILCAEAQGWERVYDRPIHEWVDNSGHKQALIHSYSPTVNLAQCFSLMVKFKISIRYSDKTVWSRECKMLSSRPAEQASMLICEVVALRHLMEVETRSDKGQ